MPLLQLAVILFTIINTKKQVDVQRCRENYLLYNAEGDTFLGDILWVEKYMYW